MQIILLKSLHLFYRTLWWRDESTVTPTLGQGAVQSRLNIEHHLQQSNTIAGENETANYKNGSTKSRSSSKQETKLMKLCATEANLVLTVKRKLKALYKGKHQWKVLFPEVDAFYDFDLIQLLLSALRTDSGTSQNLLRRLTVSSASPPPLWDFLRKISSICKRMN